MGGTKGKLKTCQCHKNDDFSRFVSPGVTRRVLRGEMADKSAFFEGVMCLRQAQAPKLSTEIEKSMVAELVEVTSVETETMGANSNNTAYRAILKHAS